MDYGSHCSDMYYFTSDNESIGLSQAHGKDISTFILLSVQQNVLGL